MRKIIFGIFAFVMSIVLLTGVVRAANSTVVVTPSDMATSFADVVAEPTSWFFYNDENDSIDNTLGSFVVGPNTAPLGSDSVQISVSGTQRRNLATYQFSGTPLGDITELKFSTYNPSIGNAGSVNRSGYLNFNVDFNGSDTWQRRLVYVPSQNGTVVQDSWQEWDAINGGNAMWSYSGSTWPVTGEPGTTLKSWSQILTDYPGVRIRVTDSWLGIRVGEPYADGYTENIDKFVFGTAAGVKTFDFDLVEEVSPTPTPTPVLVGPPTDDDQCEDSGWMQFNNPSFTSEKACEKYVKENKIKKGKVNGEIKMSNPKQKMNFELEDKQNSDKGKVEYWNYEYPGGLHYKAKALCVNVDKTTKESRFMFQIPSGFPGLSGLYVVSYVKDGGNPGVNNDLYGHSATSDLNTAQSWCQTGVGFSPAMYSVTNGNIVVH